ncbi:MAG: hypothetical protein Q9184_008074 [Pyrenodesmia sp. 2 TL-2023]
MGKSKESKPTKTELGASGESLTATTAKPSKAIESTSEHLEQAAPPATAEEEELDFESFYLKQLTAEFADDLDKLRTAGDFNERSVPILIDALKATAGVYSEEEKAKAMGEK